MAKALVAVYLTHELRRPAFLVTESNRRAEALGEFETAGGGFQNLFAQPAAYQAVTHQPWPG